MSNPLPVLNLIYGVWTARVVGTFASLKIADILAKTPCTVDKVASETNCPVDSISRLLRAIVSVGFATLDNGLYYLTESGQTLVSSPTSLRASLLSELDSAHWQLWEKLDDAVVKGDTCVEQVLKFPTVFHYYGEHKDQEQLFAQHMSALSGSIIEAVVSVYSFAGSRLVVDVGGSEGAFVKGVLNQVAEAKGIVFDLPAVANLVNTAGYQGRLEAVGGDFFKTVPQGADCYLLKFILHDWSDAHCISILSSIAKAMDPAGKIVVTETFVDQVSPSPAATLMDINMLVMSNGGRERTLKEYAELFEKAGLKLEKHILALPSPMVVIEARKA